MDWDDLKYFLELARTGTLTAAARRLQVQHSTVARRIARLERHQGGPLFSREYGGYHLNRRGRQLRRKAEEIAAEIDKLNSVHSNCPDVLTGVVRIGCTEGFGMYLFLPCLARLRATYPGLSIDLLVRPRPVQLSRNEADIVINIDRPERGPYVLAKLLDYRLGLFASPGYLRRRSAPRQITDLERHELISYVSEMEPAKALPKVEMLLHDLAPQFRSTSLNAQKEAVRSGCGIALLPHYVAAGESDMHAVLPQEVMVKKTYYMTTPKELRHTPRIASVWEFIRTEFEGHHAGRA